jgi:hypothetical protein
MAGIITSPLTRPVRPYPGKDSFYLLVKRGVYRFGLVLGTRI